MARQKSLIFIGIILLVTKIQSGISSEKHGNEELSKDNLPMPTQLAAGFPSVSEKVAIAGGYNKSYLTTVGTYGLSGLPDLPEPTSAATLSAVGQVLYYCGGVNQNNMKGYEGCLTLDTAAVEPQWKIGPRVPVHLNYHTAVVIARHIWIVTGDRLYDLDTETELTVTYDIPFWTDADSFCSVANGTHSFIVGIGINNNEIWTNSLPSDPSQWQKLDGAIKFALEASCLLFQDKIFVTGGLEDYGRKVFAHDLKTGLTDTYPDLILKRNAHSMCILKGRPAVVGGYSYETNSYLHSIETFDGEKWVKENDLELEVPRGGIGISQMK